MEAYQKGMGWLLFGILLALLGLSGGIDVPVLGWISDDFLKCAALLCGTGGMSCLYLKDTASARSRRLNN